MNKPNVLLFDIDNTLLDFSAGAMQAMEEIFRAAGLPYAPEMFAVFQVENDKLWARIERGELTIAGPGRGRAGGAGAAAWEIPPVRCKQRAVCAAGEPSAPGRDARCV